MSRLPLFEYRRQQVFETPLQQVFAFFERAELLAEVTPPVLDFRLLTPAPVHMQQGRVIDYTIRRLGLRWRWRTLISEYRPPVCFVDEQLLGPYAYWRHEHLFEEIDAGTRMTDRVLYALPNWLPDRLAPWLERLYVRPQLDNIFDYRERRFRALIDAPGDLRHTPGEQSRTL